MEDSFLEEEVVHILDILDAVVVQDTGLVLLKEEVALMLRDIQSKSEEELHNHLHIQAVIHKVIDCILKKEDILDTAVEEVLGTVVAQLEVLLEQQEQEVGHILDLLQLEDTMADLGLFEELPVLRLKKEDLDYKTAEDTVSKAAVVHTVLDILVVAVDEEVVDLEQNLEEVLDCKHILLEVHSFEGTLG